MQRRAIESRLGIPFACAGAGELQSVASRVSTGVARKLDTGVNSTTSTHRPSLDCVGSIRIAAKDCPLHSIDGCHRPITDARDHLSECTPRIVAAQYPENCRPGLGLLLSDSATVRLSSIDSVRSHSSSVPKCPIVQRSQLGSRRAQFSRSERDSTAEPLAASHHRVFEWQLERPAHRGPLSSDTPGDCSAHHVADGTACRAFSR